MKPRNANNYYRYQHATAFDQHGLLPEILKESLHCGIDVASGSRQRSDVLLGVEEPHLLELS
jgi:hypothetical protein